MAERSPIPVQILGKEYMIRGEAEDAPGIQRAAAVVDDTMAKIRERTGRVDSLEVAVLAALNIANHLVSLLSKPSPNPGEIDAASKAVEDERMPKVREIQSLQARPPKLILSHASWGEPMRRITGVLIRSGIGRGRRGDSPRHFSTASPKSA